jgi:hypothetical protein
MKKLILAITIASTTTMAIAGVDITISQKVKSDLRSKLEKDMSILNTFKFKPAEADTLKLMGVETLDSQSASKWLGDRVNYVIEENALTVFKLLVKRVIYVERDGVNYPNQYVLPFPMDPKNKNTSISPTAPVVAKNDDEDDDGGAHVVMSNIGAALYMGGKQGHQVYGMKISRGLLRKSIKVEIESPRAGIIQIGEGLFMKSLTVNNQNPDALANTINRLATFFHEARHSDGNGSSLSFAHTVCPPGHDFAGEAACDESLNGAYTVGAVMTKEMLKSCDDNCSERDKEVLKLIELDSYNRVLKTTLKGTPATEWDPTPESL